MRFRYRMRRFWNDLPSWVQVGLVLLVVVLISFMFPTGVKFDQRYEQGTRWRYDDLVAPFDFPIRKLDPELEAERDAVRARAEPYLVYDPNVANEELASFEAVFQDRFRLLPADSDFGDFRRRPDRYLKVAQGLLKRSYDRGIVDLSGPVANARSGIVHIVRGNTLTERSTASLVGPEQVREQLRDSVQATRLRDADVLVPLLQDAVQPNVRYSDSLTRRFLEANLAEIAESRGMVRQAEIIVTEDGIVSEEIYRKLESYRRQYESQVVDDSRGWFMFLGYLMLTSMIMAVLLLYIRVFHRGEFARFNRLVFILMLVLVSSFAVFRLESLNGLSVWVMPFAIVPIIIKSFYPQGVALFTHLCVVLIASFLTSLGYEFTFIQIIVGIVAVLSPTGTRDLTKFFRTILFLFFTYAVGYVGLELTKEGAWRTIDWSVFVWLGVNVFLVLLAYPLVPLLGRFFGFTSDVTLLELSDVNRPVLRELGLRAPGTFQHSLAVSNLAESAAREVGADTLLVKVAALYHDIGKSTAPLYFIENQTGRNPHDDLDELESARVIIAHVPDGVRMAKKAGLPAKLIDFIRTHHGTTRVEYFYRTWRKAHEGTPDDEVKFRYPGPLPTSKEQGILMLADSVEAAGRATRDPTQEGIAKLVDGILDAKVAHGQLNECSLSFAELEVCRAIFKTMLNSMYHARVEYPEPPEDEVVAAAPKKDSSLGKRVDEEG